MCASRSSDKANWYAGSNNIDRAFYFRFSANSHKSHWVVRFYVGFECEWHVLAASDCSTRLILSDGPINFTSKQKWLDTVAGGFSSVSSFQLSLLWTFIFAYSSGERWAEWHRQQMLRVLATPDHIIVQSINDWTFKYFKKFIILNLKAPLHRWIASNRTISSAAPEIKAKRVN